MPGVSPLLGMLMIVFVTAGLLLLVGLFYLGDRGTERRDDTEARPRRRY
ncbi:hypothetical protein [Actinomadura fibrosa]|uniref:Uncharacterized protein n=1 Tax=Actinomadura fibrosa TaxID=111802 RepID=A0ABW2XTZ3_9ACTN|nr:hypothetical protein [Actinomadura fibrosa]